MEDDQLVHLVEETDKVLALSEELNSVLREGFVNLASAKFSKGFSASYGICSNNYPYDCKPTRAVKVSKLESESEAVHVTLHNIDDLSQKFGKFKLAEEESCKEDVEQAPSTIRRRRVGLPEPPHSKPMSGNDKETEKNITAEQKETPKFDPILLWLGIQPRGQLQKSQIKFIQALEIITQLAETNIRIKQAINKNSIHTSKVENC